MDEDLGVGLREELDAVRLQLAAQVAGVVDDAVVDDGDLALGVQVGWAFTSEGAPWVAQRVCAIPVVPLKRAGTLASRSRTRPLALTVCRVPVFGAVTAMPAES